VLFALFENREEEVGKKHLVVEDKLKLCEEDKMKLNS